MTGLLCKQTGQMLQGQQSEKNMEGTESWQLGVLQQDQDEERRAPTRMEGFGKQRLWPGAAYRKRTGLISLCGVESYWRLSFTPEFPSAYMSGNTKRRKLGLLRCLVQDLPRHRLGQPPHPLELSLYLL